MVIDIKEKQPIRMMPSGVQFSMSWQRLVKNLKDIGEFSPDEIVTHIGSDLTGLTFRVDRK